jgi:hypothetical protein
VSEGGISIEGIVCGEEGVAITYLYDDELDEAEETGVLQTHQIQIPIDLSPEVREMILTVFALTASLVQTAQEAGKPQTLPAG